MSIPEIFKEDARESDAWRQRLPFISDPASSASSVPKTNLLEFFSVRRNQQGKASCRDRNGNRPFAGRACLPAASGKAKSLILRPFGGLILAVAAREKLGRRAGRSSSDEEPPLPPTAGPPTPPHSPLLHPRRAIPIAPECSHPSMRLRTARTMPLPCEREYRVLIVCISNPFSFYRPVHSLPPWPSSPPSSLTSLAPFSPPNHSLPLSRTLDTLAAHLSPSPSQSPAPSGSALEICLSCVGALSQSRRGS